MTDRRAYLTAKKREQRENARAAGLCIICAKSPAPKPLVTCDPCRQKVSDARRVRNSALHSLAT